ncbi:hypothetical protein [Xanthobacter sediminis]
MTRTTVHLNWEAGDHAYLSITRPDQPVERIPLTTADVARLLADGAYLWSVVEPRRQGEAQIQSPRQPNEVPCFIGAFGE